MWKYHIYSQLASMQSWSLKSICIEHKTPVWQIIWIFILPQNVKKSENLLLQSAPLQERIDRQMWKRREILNRNWFTWKWRWQCWWWECMILVERKLHVTLSLLACRQSGVTGGGRMVEVRNRSRERGVKDKYKYNIKTIQIQILNRYNTNSI